jgi:hypothetical protein
MRLRSCTVISISALLTSVYLAGTAHADDPWVVYKGKEGPGKDKRVVLVAADDEYRSEELIPQLAKILAVRHGFTCTVLFAIDKKDGTINPGQRDNIPGLEALKSADLFVLFARFRELPDEQMKHIIDYLDARKPIIGLRTSTHAFDYPGNSKSPYAKYTWTSREPPGGFGKSVFGETWVDHFGLHNVQSTRGLVAFGMDRHPIVRAVTDIWGPSDVYAVTKLPPDSRPVVMGVVLKGMKPDDPPVPDKHLVPIAWTRTLAGSNGKNTRVFATTMGHAGDFQSEGVRRMLVNACYWCLRLEKSLPARSNVELVGDYDPPRIGEGGHRKGIRPAQLALP